MAHLRDEICARPNWIEVDLAAIAHNLRVLRNHVGPDVQIYAALKANAYGLGLVEVARVIDATSEAAIAVVALEDAVKLRTAGIRAPILLFSGSLATPGVVETVERHDLIATICDRETAEGYARHAKSPLRVFVELNCGGERFGLSPREAPDVIRWLREQPNIEVAGLYTHPGIPASPRALECVEWQYGRFVEVAEALEPPVPIRMMASSGILQIDRKMFMTAVDPGNLVYGLAADGPGQMRLNTRPALVALKSRLVHAHVADRPAFHAEAPFPLRPGMRIGVFPLGSSDRLHDLNLGEVLVRGRRAAILGKLSAEHAKIDLSGIPDAEVGEEVVIIGRQGTDAISIDAVAAHRGVAVAQVQQGLPLGVPRVYLGKAEHSRTMAAAKVAAQ